VFLQHLVQKSIFCLIISPFGKFSLGVMGLSEADQIAWDDFGIVGKKCLEVGKIIQFLKFKAYGLLSDKFVLRKQL
jgi:hypothetical protein